MKKIALLLALAGIAVAKEPTQLLPCRTPALITRLAACLNGAKVFCVWGLLLAIMSSAASDAAAKDGDAAALKAMVEGHMASAKNQAKEAEQNHTTAKAACELAGRLKKEAMAKLEQARLGYFAKVCATGAKTPESAAMVDQVRNAVKRLDEVEVLKRAKPSVLEALAKEKALASTQYEKLRRDYLTELRAHTKEVYGDAGLLKSYHPFGLKLLRSRVARTEESGRAELQQQIQRFEQEYNSLKASHAEALKAWTVKSEQYQTARTGCKDTIGKALDETYRNALIKADGRLTPNVRYAFMALRQFEAFMELHKAGIHLPDELLCWVDYRGVVGATVYGMRFGRPR